MMDVDHDLKNAVHEQGATVLPGNRIMLVGGEGDYDNNVTYKYPKHVNEVPSLVGRPAGLA